MRKKILLSFVCFTMTGLMINAQTKKAPPPPPPPAPIDLPAPAPPPPPPPPAEPVFEKELPVPPAPPAPPIRELASSTIINNHGYEINIEDQQGNLMIHLKKEDKISRIKLSTWNEKRKYYEKKFGQLPPLKEAGI